MKHILPSSLPCCTPRKKGNYLLTIKSWSIAAGPRISSWQTSACQWPDTTQGSVHSPPSSLLPPLLHPSVPLPFRRCSMQWSVSFRDETWRDAVLLTVPLHPDTGLFKCFRKWLRTPLLEMSDAECLQTSGSPLLSTEGHESLRVRPLPPQSLNNILYPGHI